MSKDLWWTLAVAAMAINALAIMYALAQGCG
jgi:hypothetical protein